MCPALLIPIIPMIIPSSWLSTPPPGVAVFLGCLALLCLLTGLLLDVHWDIYRRRWQTIVLRVLFGIPIVCLFGALLAGLIYGLRMVLSGR